MELGLSGKRFLVTGGTRGIGTGGGRRTAGRGCGRRVLRAHPDAVADGAGELRADGAPPSARRSTWVTLRR